MLKAVMASTFLTFFGIVVVMGYGVMLVLEPEFRIGNAVRRRADVGADAGRVGLERQHVQVAHHLHVLAAFVAFWNLDLDGRGIRGVAFAHADSSLLQRRLLLAEFDGGDAAFDGTHAVQVFIQFVLIVLGQFPAKVFGASDNQVQHLPIQRVRLDDGVRVCRTFRRDGSARCAD